MNETITRNEYGAPRVGRGVAAALLAAALGLWHTSPAVAEGAVALPGRNGAFKYATGPAPAYVVRHAVETAEVDGGHPGSLRFLLMERQISLLEPQPQYYVRFVLQPKDTQALQEASNIQLVFNPDYEQLTVHAIRVVRQGKAQDRTRSTQLELLQQEKGLDQNLYGGDVTAVGVLTDVRVDDQVEVEYSITGANPIFGGRVGWLMPLQGRLGVEESRVRVVHPVARELRVKAPPQAKVAREVRGTTATEVVLARGLKPVADDVDRPAWADPVPYVEIGEYADWDDVRRWATKLFQVDGQLAPGLQRQVGAWKAQGLAPPVLAGEVLRWVQREVRYFGIELGVNSHQPASPNTTYERRFGDCKDKSLLLATLLNAVGIDAKPALVSLRFNRKAAELLPNPTVFDHTVVRVRIEGKTWWLDPTLPPQPGSIAVIGVHNYGKALVLGEESRGLADAGYPPGYVDEVFESESYQVKAWTEPALVTTDTRVAGARAERLRAALAQNRGEVQRAVQSDFMRATPGAEPVGQLAVADDLKKNQLTLVQHYRLRDFLRYETGKFLIAPSSGGVAGYFPVPQAAQRSTPLAMQRPLRVHYKLSIEVPENTIRSAPAPATVRTPYWSLAKEYAVDDRHISAEMVLDSRVESVEPEAVPDYLQALRKLRGEIGVEATMAVATLSDAARERLKAALEPYDRFGRSASDGVDAEVTAHVSVARISADLSSGKLTAAQRAAALHARGLAYDNLDQREAALRDVGEAVRLDPENTDYQLGRADVLSLNGEFAEAQQVYLKFHGAGNIQEPKTLMHYGRALLYSGRDSEAAAIFAEAARDGDLYAALWQHLSVGAAKAKTDSILAQQMGRARGREWPYAIGEMLLGERTLDSLLEVANSDDPGVTRDRRCEAYFYAGKKYMQDGDRLQAVRLFWAAYEEKALPYVEYKFAKVELNRLGVAVR